MLQTKDAEIEQFLKEWLVTNFDSLIPEEVVIVVSKYREDPQFKQKTQEYITANLEQMNLDEALKLLLTVQDASEQKLGEYFSAKLIHMNAICLSLYLQKTETQPQVVIREVRRVLN